MRPVHSPATDRRHVVSIDTRAIETHSTDQRRFALERADFLRERASAASSATRSSTRRASIRPETFWQRETQDLVFRKRWSELSEWKPPFAKWFLGAQLNASESCLDRHLTTARRDARAIVWESEPGETRTLTYAELHARVVELAAALRELGAKKGDRIAIYMGMVPEVVVGMLACARIGAAHTVVFGGFAAESLRDRINDCQARFVLTQDGAYRRGGIVPLKATVDQALEGARERREGARVPAPRRRPSHRSR